MCHKFSFHGPDLSILGVRVACPKYQGPSSGVQCPRVLDPRVPSSESEGGPRFRISGPDFRLCQPRGLQLY